MDEAQRTLAEDMAVPLIMLVLTSIVALVGWLVSRQLTAWEKQNDQQDQRLVSLERQMIQVRQHLGLIRPSDTFKISPPREGGSSA